MIPAEAAFAALRQLLLSDDVARGEEITLPRVRALRPGMLEAHAKTAIDTAIALGLMEVGLSYPANVAILLPGDLRRIAEAALVLLRTLAFEQTTYQAMLDHLRERQSAAANSELAFIYRLTADRLHLALNQNPEYRQVLV